MGYRMFVTVEHLTSAAHYAAPLGLKAVEDAVREMCEYEGLLVKDLKVTRHTDKYYRILVSINHVDKERPDDREQLTAFEVYNPNIKSAKWEDNLKHIKWRQGEMPPHLRGLEHNATQEQTDFVLDVIRKATGYDGLCYGDIWVHVGDGVVLKPMGPFSLPPHIQAIDLSGRAAFGELTRAGEIAMRKYKVLLSKRVDDIGGSANAEGQL